MKKVKVLHLLSKLDPGGVERWLVGVGNSDSLKYEHHFLCISGTEGRWANELENVYIYPHLKNGKFFFLKELIVFLKNNDFEIIHSHLYMFSLPICIISKGLGLKAIAHSHNDKRKPDNINSLYLSSMKNKVVGSLFNMFSDRRLAASKSAGEAIFYKNNFQILFCGVLIPYFEKKDFVIQTNNIRFVNVGSLTYQKNQEFLIDLAKELKKRKFNNFHISIVGQGEMKDFLVNKIINSQVSDYISLLGVKDDIYSFFSKETDVFLFPSRFEGLGLALIEAQAAGLKCIISKSIPEEADIFKPNVKRLDLDVEIWADEIQKVNINNVEQRKVLNKLADKSEFNILLSCQRLHQIYDEI